MTEPREVVAKGVKELHPVAKDLDAVAVEHILQGAAEKPENWKKTLEFTIEEDKTEHKLHQLVESIPAGAEKTAAETLVNRALARLEGMGNLTGNDLTEARKAFYNQFKSHPIFRGELAATLSDADVKNFIDKIISDTLTELHLRRELGNVAELKIDQTLIDDVAETKDKLDLTEFKRDKKKDEKDEAQKRLESVDNQLSAFDRSKPNEADWGQKAQDIEDKKRRKPKLESNVEIHKQKLEQANDRVRYWAGQLKSFDAGNYTGSLKKDQIIANLDQAKEGVIQVQEDLDKFQVELNELKQLQEEEKNLRKEKDDLEEKLTGKKDEHQTLITEYNNAERAYNRAKAKLEAEGQKIVAELEAVWGRTAAQWANEVIRQMSDSMFEQLQAFQAAVKDKHLEVLAVRFQEDLFHQVDVTTGKLWWKKTRKEWQVDETKAETRFNELATKGLDGVVRAYLDSQTNPETGRTYTDEDLDKLLRKEDFFKNARSFAFQNLVRAKLIDGGLDQREIFFLTSLPEGAKMLEDAMEGYGGFRKAVDKVAEKEGFADASPEDRAKRALAISPLLLLLLLGITLPTVLPEET